MIGLTIFQFIAFGAVCTVLGFIVAINLKLTTPNKKVEREKRDGDSRLKEYLKVYYRPRYFRG